MAAHEPSWVETHRSGGTVYFRCTQCGAKVSGSEKAYDAGKWFPSVATHK